MPDRAYETVSPANYRASAKARELHTQALDAIAGRDWSTAERLLKEALALDVMFGPAHNNLGRVYYAQNQLYLAAWEFQYAIKLMPHHPEPRNNLGLVFEAANRHAEARDQYETALGYAPRHPEVMGNLARLRVRTGEHSDDLRELLQELVLVDARPEWNQWAREQAIRLGASIEPTARPGSATPDPAQP